MDNRHPRHRKTSLLIARIRFAAAVVVPLVMVVSAYIAVREYESPADARSTLSRVAADRLDDTTGRGGERDDLPALPTPTVGPTTPSPTAGERLTPQAPVETGAPEAAATPGGSAPGPNESSETDEEPTDRPVEAPWATATPTVTASPTPTPSEPPPSSPSATPTPTPSASPTASPTMPPRPTPTLQPPNLTRAEQSALDASNHARRRAGCPDLRVDAHLMTAAREHSADMYEHRYFAHTDPFGRGPADRALAAGYDEHVEQNIARGLLGGAGAVANWMLKAESRRTLTNCDFTAVGIGARGGLLNTWWTQVLGTR